MAKILDEGIQKQVQEVFSELDHPVEVLFFQQKENCEYCDETRQLIEEVTGLSDKLHLQVFDLLDNADIAERYHVDKAPMTVLAGKNGDELIDYGIRLAGIPAGHEFTSLINDLLLVSKRESGLSQPTRTYLAGLTEPVVLQVFTTPT